MSAVSFAVFVPSLLSASQSGGVVVWCEIFRSADRAEADAFASQTPGGWLREVFTCR